MLNRAARRAMAKCKHILDTKTDGAGRPSLTVCRNGCGYEIAVTDAAEADRG